MTRRHHLSIWVGLMACITITACEQARMELEEMRDSVRVPDREEVAAAVETLVEDTRAELNRETQDPVPDEASAPAETTGPVPRHIAATPPSPQTEPASAGQADVFPQTLQLCDMNPIANAPETQDGVITGYAPLVQARADLALAMAPVAEGCLSSGFGPRGDSLHKGVDLYHNINTAIYAAGPGTIKEIKYRNDYGNMIVIDHGAGVYTRYAHLAHFAAGLEDGTPVGMGQTLGAMGNTASYRIPVHLHYELLEGEWDPEAGSFGLEPVDMFSLPPAN